MTDRLILTSTARYDIAVAAGRRTAFTVPSPFTFPHRGDLGILIGQEAEIDGTAYTIKAVEWYAVSWGPKKGQTISLLVDPLEGGGARAD